MAEYLNEKAFKSLRRDIILLELQPGAVLSTARVAEKYQVSRTPAREALLKLHGIGLADMFPKSKTVVSRINTRRLYQEWFVRKSLEVAVIDDFLRNCCQQDLDDLAALNDEMERYSQAGEFASFFDSDNAFHQKIFTAARQQLAWDLIEDINCHYNRLRVVVMRDGRAQREAIEEHRRILHAMSRRDAPLIRQLMSAHTQKISIQQEEAFARFPQYFCSGE